MSPHGSWTRFLTPEIPCAGVGEALAEQGNLPAPLCARGLANNFGGLFGSGGGRKKKKKVKWKGGRRGRGVEGLGKERLGLRLQADYLSSESCSISSRIG